MTALASEALQTEVLQVARDLDAIIGRLTYDPEFAAALAENARETLDAAEIRLPSEALEAFIRWYPERFDKASESLFSRVDSDFLTTLGPPSCA